MIQQHGIAVRGLGLGAVCDIADVAEGLCDPLTGAPDFSVTGTGKQPSPAIDLTDYFNMLGGNPNLPGGTGTGSGGGGARGNTRPVGGIVPKCGLDNLNACGATAAGWISENSTMFAVGLLLFVVVASSKGGRR